MTSADVDLAALPNPQSITLLLKNHKSTTLLSAQPASTFSDIKALLQAALQSRNVPDVPKSADLFELGVLANQRDASKGWIPIQQRVHELATGKSAKKAPTGKKSVSGDTMESAGLLDGSWVAWRVRATSEKEERWTKLDEDGDAVVDMDDDDEEEDPGWDVVIPKYEDEEET